MKHIMIIIFLIIRRDPTNLYELVYDELPNDQMSTSGPYGNRDITSGLIQYGVPTSDLRFGSSGDTWAQNPKSDSLTCKHKILIYVMMYKNSR